MKRWIAVLAALMIMCSAMPAFAGAVDCREGNHTWSMGDVHQRPTCTEDAYYMLECQYCDATEKVVTEKATGHDWGKWKVTKEATCTEEGVRKHTCKTCGKTKEEKIDKLAHSWDEGTIIRESTDFSTGLRRNVCTECQTTKETEFYPDGTLMKGMKGDPVRELQEKLNAAGYDCGKADGDYGKKTAAAISALEKDHDFDADGIAWPGVQKWLGGDVTAFGGDTAELRFIQTLLADDGLMSFDEANGEWSEKTAQAIVARCGYAAEPDSALMLLLIGDMMGNHADSLMYIIDFPNGIWADCTWVADERYTSNGDGTHYKEVYALTVCMVDNAAYEEIQYTLETPYLVHATTEYCNLRNGVTCAYCDYAIGTPVENLYLEFDEPVIGVMPATSVRVTAEDPKIIKGGSVTLSISDWEYTLDGENYLSLGGAPFAAGYTYTPCIDLSGINYTGDYMPVTDHILIYANNVPMAMAMNGNMDVSRYLRYKLGEWHDITIHVGDAKNTVLKQRTNGFGCLDSLPGEAEYPNPGRFMDGFVTADNESVDETTVFTEDTDIYGIWHDDKDTVTIEFSVNGSIVPELTQVLTVGGKLSKLPVHADFDNWLITWTWYNNGSKEFSGAYFTEDTVLYGAAQPFRYRTTQKDCILYDRYSDMTGVRTFTAGCTLPVVDGMGPGNGNYLIVYWEGSVRYCIHKDAFMEAESSSWPVYFDAKGFEVDQTMCWTDSEGRLNALPEVNLPEGVELVGWYRTDYQNEDYRVSLDDVYTCGTTLHAVYQDNRYKTMFKPVAGWQPIYAEPDMDSAVEGYLENGGAYTELDSKGEYWKKIETEDCAGWIYCSGEEDACEATYAADSAMNIYAQPDPESLVIGKVAKDSTLIVLDITEDAGSQWYKIVCDNGVGYVCGDLTPTEPHIYQITLVWDDKTPPVVRNTDADGHLRDFSIDGVETDPDNKPMWFLVENGMRYIVNASYEFTQDTEIYASVSAEQLRNDKIDVYQYYNDELYRYWSIEAGQAIDLETIIDGNMVEWHVGDRNGPRVNVTKYELNFFYEDTKLFAVMTGAGSLQEILRTTVVYSDASVSYPIMILEPGVFVKAYHCEGEYVYIEYEGTHGYIFVSSIENEEKLVCVHFDPLGGSFEYETAFVKLGHMYNYVEEIWGFEKGSCPDPVRPGYRFVGWSLNGSIPKQYVFATGSMLIAVWEPKTYTITFETGTGETIEPLSVTSDDTTYQLPAISRTGYKFLGWFDEDSGAKYYNGRPITENITLCARWERTAPGCTITFIGDADKGYGYVMEGKGSSATYSKTAEYETLPEGTLEKLPKAIYDPDDPKDTNHKFEGWYTEDGKRVTKKTVFEEDTTLKARWSVNATVNIYEKGKY